MNGLCRKRVAIAGRLGLAVVALTVMVATLSLGDAHATGNGYSDGFEYPSVPAPLTAGASDPWQISKGTWNVDTRTDSTNPLVINKVLTQSSLAGPPDEPIAFVRNRNFTQTIVQVKANFDMATPPNDSGIGIVFRSPVDPVTHFADRNNYYLFTAVNTSPNPRTFPTGRGFALFKRLGGAYFIAALTHTYLDLTKPHVYKAIASGGHILCFVDGVLQIEVTDTPGDDITSSFFAMPGPPFGAGTAGLRTSKAKAAFDDFTVIGNPAYEGRAAAVDGFVTTGINQLGVTQVIGGGDTGFQYHDHDFPTGGPGNPEGTVIAPVGTQDGSVTAGTTLRTRGVGGTVTSTASLVGVAGMFQTPMGSGNLTITFNASAITAEATASCAATSSKVDIVNFSYEILFTSPGNEPIVDEGKVTKLSAPANTVVVNQPIGTSGFVKISAHQRNVSTQPMRVDASAIRIQVMTAAPSTASPAPQSPFFPVSVDVAVGSVVAGRLCTPV